MKPIRFNNKFKNKKLAYVTASAFILSALLTIGCGDTYTSTDFVEDTIYEGKALIIEYLDRRYQDNYALSSINAFGNYTSLLSSSVPSTGTPTYCRIAFSTFYVDNYEYYIYADVDTGTIYTDEYRVKMNDYYSAQFAKLLKDYSTDTDSAGNHIDFTTCFDNFLTGTTVNTKTYNGTAIDQTLTTININRCYPAELTESELLQTINDPQSRGQNLVVFYESADQNLFTPEMIKFFMDNNPGIDKLELHNVNGAAYRIAKENDEICSSLGLTLKETYTLTQEDVYQYEHYTYSVYREGPVAVNYVSHLTSILGQDLDVITEKDYEVPVEINPSDPRFITTHTPVDSMPAYLYFPEEPDYKHATLTTSDNNIFNYNISLVQCNLYTLVPDYLNPLSYTGFSIMEETTIQLKKR